MKAHCHRFLILLAVFAGIATTPAPATSIRLGIAPAGSGVVLSWPVTTTNYVLQSTPSLVPANWALVSNVVPVVVNNTNRVTLTNTARASFFRLYFNANPTGVRLNIATAGTNFVLSWPVTATNYVLQSTPNLVPATWATITNIAPVVINSTNFVTVTNNSRSSFFRLYLNTNATGLPAGMVLIPAGSFTMGNSIGDNDIYIQDASPTNVNVSAFYMETNLVSYNVWQSVYNWATNAGYNFDHAGAGKGLNHPAQTVNWYDAVKWCNARSQQAGLTPVYYTDAGLTQIYTNGDVSTVYVNWTTNGYRLPTEAEWEKAARGGLSGKRFPLANNISHSQANYFGNPSQFNYDSGPDGYDTPYVAGDQPYTSPVGSFPPNGYGLYDMGGNVCQWCWDWYGTPYTGGTDPRGPNSGSARVYRGGRFDFYAVSVRCADRNNYFLFGPSNADFGLGFRCVRSH